MVARQGTPPAPPGRPESVVDPTIQVRRPSDDELRAVGEPAIVELVDVSKSFGDTTVLDDLHLRVPEGQIYGLIGPSGCGKTTAIRMFVGVLEPSAGTVRVMGVEPRHFSTRDREQIGYTPQGFYLYPTLTVSENVRFVAGLFGIAPWRRGRRVREMLEFFELWDARDRLARDISGGMQRRLSLACALIHKPTLLIVDEPTAGLDPVLREKIWGLLRQLRDEGRTIIVSTQYIDEAAYCDTVAVMNSGRIVALGTPDELREEAADALRERTGGQVLEVETSGPVERADLVALLALDGVQSVEWKGAQALWLRVDDAAECTPDVTRVLVERGVETSVVRPTELTFDEVFLSIVDRDDEDRGAQAGGSSTVAGAGKGGERRVTQHR